MKPLTINLRHLVTRNLHLKGEISAEELDLNQLDELVHVAEPVQYDLEVQKMEKGLLALGQVTARLDCECARCLKPFVVQVDLPNFTLQLLREGEDAAAFSGDYVDLTPFLREDIVLAFPQHPLCEAGCAGLKPPPGSEAQPGPESQMTSSAWAVLNELKL